MKTFLLIFFIFIFSIAILKADNVIYTLDNGNITNYETDSAEVIDDTVNGTYSVYTLDWNVYGYGYVSNIYLDPPTNSVLITNINQASYFLKKYKLTNAEYQQQKPLYLKIFENQYINYCDAILGTTNKIKASIPDLIPKMREIRRNDIASAIAIQLLAVDSECKYYNGANWWDTCEYHPEIPDYYCTLPPEAEIVREEENCNIKALSLIDQVAFYKFNRFRGENLNQLRDHSEESMNDGTVYYCSRDVGIFGGCYVLNNSSNKIVIPNDPSLKMGTNDLTISVWIGMVNTNIEGEASILMNKKSKHDIGYGFSFSNNVNDNITLKFYINSNSIDFTIPQNHDDYWEPKNWMNIAVKRVNSNLYLYANGYEVNHLIGSQYAEDVSNTNDLIFGYCSTNFVSYNGYLDNTRIFRRNLAFEEIKKLDNLETELLSIKPKSDFYQFYPGNGVPKTNEGVMYYDRSYHNIRYYDGSKWNILDDNLLSSYYANNNPSNFASINWVTNQGYLTSALTNGFITATNGMIKILDYLYLKPTNAPDNPQEGMVYYDKNSSNIKCYDGSSWRNLFGLIQ